MCGACDMKRRGSEVYDNIKEFLRPQIEGNKEIRSWEIEGILRPQQQTYGFYFVDVHAKTDNGCNRITYILKESPGVHKLTLVPFVDVLEVKDAGKLGWVTHE